MSATIQRYFDIINNVLDAHAPQARLGFVVEDTLRIYGKEKLLDVYREISNGLKRMLFLKEHVEFSECLLEVGLNPVDFMALNIDDKNAVRFLNLETNMAYRPLEEVCDYYASLNEIIISSEKITSIANHVFDTKFESLREVALFVHLAASPYPSLALYFLAQPDLNSLADKIKNNKLGNIFLGAIYNHHTKTPKDFQYFNSCFAEIDGFDDISSHFVAQLLKAASNIDKKNEGNGPEYESYEMISYIIKRMKIPFEDIVDIVLPRLRETNAWSNKLLATLCGYLINKSPAFIDIILDNINRERIESFLYTVFSTLDRALASLEAVRLVKQLDERLIKRGHRGVSNTEIVHAFLRDWITALEFMKLGLVLPGMPEQQDFCENVLIHNEVKAIEIAIKLNKTEYICKYLERHIQAINEGDFRRKEAVETIINSKFIDIHNSRFDQKAMVNMLFNLGFTSEEIRARNLGKEAKGRVLEIDIGL